MRIRQVAAIAGALLMVGGLAACEPTLPEPTSAAPKPVPSVSAKPTATAKPSATPAAPVAARVEIDGSGLTVAAADESTIVNIPFGTDAATAATQLGTAIGLAPTITTSTGDSNCSVDQTQYAWGGLVLRAPGSYAAAPGATFIATALAPTTANGLPVVIPSGHAVGTPTSVVLAANPGVPAEGEPTGDSVVYFDVLSGHPLGDMDSFYGAAAFANGGSITSLVSPIFYYYDC